MALNVDATGTQLFISELGAAVIAQAVHHPDGDPALSVIDPALLEDPALEAALVTDPAADIAPEDIVIKDGMSAGDLEALATAKDSEAATYDGNAQTQRALRFGEENQANALDAAAQAAQKDAEYDSREAEAEKHEIRAAQADGRADKHMDDRDAAGAQADQADMAAAAVPKPPPGAG